MRVASTKLATRTLAHSLLFMPELPEVETTVRALRPFITNQTFTEIRNYWPRHIATSSVEEFQARLHGQTVESVGRRGKYLLFNLDSGDVLSVHLKMTGHLAIVPQETPPDKYAHTIFGLANGQEMRFRDTRKFGRIYLAANAEEIVGKLGPEPLSDAYTAAIMKERMNGRWRAIKPLLLDQHFVAGVGNIYADESLFYAGIHPTRPCDTLSDDEIERLHTAVRKVLQEGIDREGTTISTYRQPDGRRGDMQNALAVFRRTGEPCYDCGAIVERIVLGGRSTHFCPVCQTK